MTAWQKRLNAANWRNGKNWVVILADKASKAVMIWMKRTSKSVHEWKTWKNLCGHKKSDWETSMIRLLIAQELDRRLTASLTSWNEKRFRWDTMGDSLSKSRHAVWTYLEKGLEEVTPGMNLINGWATRQLEQWQGRKCWSSFCKTTTVKLMVGQSSPSQGPALLMYSSNFSASLPFSQYVPMNVLSIAKSSPHDLFISQKGALNSWKLIWVFKNKTSFCLNQPRNQKSSSPPHLSMSSKAWRACWHAFRGQEPVSVFVIPFSIL